MSAISPERLAEIRPRVVCLCGSTRFWRSFMEWYGRLTDEGCIVLTIGRIVAQSEGQLGETRKVALDELHLRKIDLADEVFVLDVGGYTGASTKREIAHAEATGKPVRYLSREFPEYVEPDEPELVRAMRQRDAELERLRAPAAGDEETAREIAQLHAGTPDSCNYAEAVEKIAAALSAARAQAIEEAAKLCATSHAGDCCHETAERNAAAIRALAAPAKEET